jgi:hypothetical protein
MFRQPFFIYFSPMLVQGDLKWTRSLGRSLSSACRSDGHWDRFPFGIPSPCFSRSVNPTQTPQKNLKKSRFEMHSKADHVCSTSLLHPPAHSLLSLSTDIIILLQCMYAQTLQLLIWTSWSLKQSVPLWAAKPLSAERKRCTPPEAIFFLK